MVKRCLSLCVKPLSFQVKVYKNGHQQWHEYRIWQGYKNGNTKEFDGYITCWIFLILVWQICLCFTYPWESSLATNRIDFSQHVVFSGTSFQQSCSFITHTINLWIGPPARSVGWRDPGYIHTSYLKELWPNRMYVVLTCNILIVRIFLFYYIIFNEDANNYT